MPIANALLSTVNAARQRQPMCAECELSLPNQIVFDKVSSEAKVVERVCAKLERAAHLIASF